jgi:hypothetical protein
VTQAVNCQLPPITQILAPTVISLRDYAKNGAHRNNSAAHKRRNRHWRNGAMANQAKSDGFLTVGNG